MPDHSQFSIDRTCPGRWTITFSNPPINIFVPTTIVELGALMTDLEADPSVKVVVFQSAKPNFFVAHPLLASPGAQARRAKIREVGYGVPSDFELNFGRYLPSFGPEDDDATGQET